jgi:uncharacterized protein HemX
MPHGISQKAYEEAMEEMHNALLNQQAVLLEQQTRTYRDALEKAAALIKKYRNQKALDVINEALRSK